MSTMKTFYNLLGSVAGAKSPYLQALAKLTRIDIGRMKVFETVPGWQQWGEQNQKAVTV
jgi:hypothetical protein